MARRYRPAFTLTEMLVALAVMVLALAVVTSVFSVTTKTASTSAAIGDVETLVRSFAKQLQEDLEYCDSSRSILVIVGRTQAAAVTDDARQAGQFYRVFTGDLALVPASYDPRFDPGGPGSSVPRDQFSDPRADILLFFTNRLSASKAPPTVDLSGSQGSFQGKLQSGARVAPIQVVYGHAALDQAVQAGSNWAFADNLQHIEQVDAAGRSWLPANRWHLGRRAALFDSSTTNTDLQNDGYPRVWRCYSNPMALPVMAGDSVLFDFESYLQEFQPHLSAGIMITRALLSPYGFSPGSFVGGVMHWNTDAAGQNLILRALYPGGDETNHHVATVIEQPPAALQDNLGVHLLPGCAWFQVEILIPEDPRNGLDHPLADQRRDTPRWVAVEPGQTYVFVPDSEENRELVRSQVFPSGHSQAGRVLPAPNRLRNFAQVIPPTYASNPNVNMPYGGDTADNRVVRMWPYAIRVTVRVFDQRGRLAEPIVRSVVHRFD